MERPHSSAQQEGRFRFISPSNLCFFSLNASPSKRTRGAEICVLLHPIAFSFYIPCFFQELGIFAPGSPPLPVPISLSLEPSMLFSKSPPSPPKTSAVFEFIPLVSFTPSVPPFLLPTNTESCCPLGSPPHSALSFEGGKRDKTARKQQNSPCPPFLPPPPPIK